MISKKVEKELNKQINAELYSAYLYLAMSAWFQEKNLKGFANWMYVQYQEETNHAQLFYNFILERGGKVEFNSIAAPKTSWKSVIDVFSETLKHEQHVTSLIHGLMNVAISEKDHASASFLQWFVNEQVEEEANATDILEQLKMIEGKGAGLFMLDRELKARVFTPANMAGGSIG